MISGAGSEVISIVDADPDLLWQVAERWRRVRPDEIGGHRLVAAET